MPILCKLLTANFDSGFNESAIANVATRRPMKVKSRNVREDIQG